MVLFGVLGIALLAAFALLELRVADPMIDVRLFKNKLFTASNIVQVVGQGGLMGALFLVPILLQAEMGLTALESGLATFPQALGVVSMMQVASRAYGRIGPRRLMMVGLAGATLTTLAFVLVDLETSAWWIRLIMFLRGWAFALVLVSLQTATFATIPPKDMGRASAAYNALRQVAASLGVAIAATVLTNRLSANGAVLGNPGTRDGAITAFHESFAVAAGLTVLGILAALLVSDKEAAVSMRSGVVTPSEEAPVIAQ